MRTALGVGVLVPLFELYKRYLVVGLFNFLEVGGSLLLGGEDRIGALDLVLVELFGELDAELDEEVSVLIGGLVERQT